MSPRMSNDHSDSAPGTVEELTLLRRRLARERARREAAEEIGERVTAELYDRVEELRALDRTRDDFVHNVSHELRTPLTSIAGYLEMVADGSYGDVPAGVERAVAVALRNTDRLRTLVEDLLTFSAYDAAGVALERATVDLAAVAEQCRRASLPLLDGRRLEVQLHAAPDLRPIEADPSQIGRVVTNLLSNAVKFTPDGGRVTLEVGNREDGVELVVSDTGVGIPAAEQSRLFERFFRSSLSVAAETQGTGLGLALTRTIVEMHHGTVTITSTEGAGTRVTVTLPCGPRP